MTDSAGSASGISYQKPQSMCRWGAVLLCCGMITICYVDRVNVAVAAPTLMKIFKISPAEMGILMSAFFWTYVLAMMPAGIVLNRFGPKLVGFCCNLGWGIITVLTCLVTGFKSMMAVRIALGAIEAPSYPISTRVVSVWVPARERTFSSAAFDSCSRIGNAVTPPLVVWLLTNWGWQVSFVITGSLALLYSLVWKLKYHEPDEHPRVTDSELTYIRQDEIVKEDGQVEKSKPISILQLFTYKRMILVCLGAFCYDYYWTNFNMWVPAYLVSAKGFDLKTMGMIAMAPYIAGVLMELLGGYVMDTWYRHGASLNVVRRVGIGACLLLAAGTLYIAIFSSSPVVIATCLTASMGIFSFGAGSGKWSIPSDIAPYGQAGGVASVMNFCGMFGSIIAPILTGYVANSAFGYNGGFVVMAIIVALGALFYGINDYSRLVAKE